MTNPRIPRDEFYRWLYTSDGYLASKSEIADKAAELFGSPEPPSGEVGGELAMIDGRRPKIEPAGDGRVRITSDDSRGLYLNSDGRWESYRGEYKSWQSEADAIAFLKERRGKGE